MCAESLSVVLVVEKVGAAAISIVLLVISFVVLFILRAIGPRAARREELAQ